MKPSISNEFSGKSFFCFQITDSELRRIENKFLALCVFVLLR